MWFRPATNKAFGRRCKPLGFGMKWWCIQTPHTAFFPMTPKLFGQPFKPTLGRG